MDPELLGRAVEFLGGPAKLGLEAPFLGPKRFEPVHEAAKPFPLGRRHRTELRASVLEVAPGALATRGGLERLRTDPVERRPKPVVEPGESGALARRGPQGRERPKMVERQALDGLGVVALDQYLVQAELVGVAGVVVREVARRLVVDDLETAVRRPVDSGRCSRGRGSRPSGPRGALRPRPGRAAPAPGTRSTAVGSRGREPGTETPPPEKYNPRWTTPARRPRASPRRSSIAPVREGTSERAIHRAFAVGRSRRPVGPRVPRAARRAPRGPSGRRVRR